MSRSWREVLGVVFSARMLVALLMGFVSGLPLLLTVTLLQAWMKTEGVDLGTIGLFAVLIARGLGAAKVIGVDVDPRHAELARQLGCDAVLQPVLPPKDRPHASDPALIDQVRALTGGIGVDVAMERAGFNSALNNAVKMTRRASNGTSPIATSTEALLY